MSIFVVKKFIEFNRFSKEPMIHTKVNNSSGDMKHKDKIHFVIYSDLKELLEYLIAK